MGGNKTGNNYGRGCTRTRTQTCQRNKKYNAHLSSRKYTPYKVLGPHVHKLCNKRDNLTAMGPRSQHMELAVHVLAVNLIGTSVNVVGA